MEARVGSRLSTGGFKTMAWLRCTCLVTLIALVSRVERYDIYVERYRRDIQATGMLRKFGQR